MHIAIIASGSRRKGALTGLTLTHCDIRFLASPIGYWLGGTRTSGRPTWSRAHRHQLFRSDRIALTNSSLATDSAGMSFFARRDKARS